MSKWVYIIAAQNFEGDSAMVLVHTRTLQDAQTLVQNLRRIDADRVADWLQASGPVRDEDYPIGKIIREGDD
ncbi:MAG: hypothetical protein E6Q97_00225 [Desulfurellales bacterium]|nr:MAG: hypothetical protein E6Q97_00225 [Desulfurellales bacterium]